MTDAHDQDSRPGGLLLERIQPTLGRGDRIPLVASRMPLRVGRAEENEIRLLTASASRRHATIELDGAGRWVIVPVEGRVLRVDGDEVAGAVVLEPGLNLVMGGDHLRCIGAEDRS
jgi:pSer/pThr/pTyr-binding forkhead associated (FHA) protein